MAKIVTNMEDPMTWIASTLAVGALTAKDLVLGASYPEAVTWKRALDVAIVGTTLTGIHVVAKGIDKDL